MRRESLTLALVLGAYFALQVLLRIWIGTGLQLDEAELVMRAQEFRWGYGPQLPLFNWLQFLTFKLIGVNVAALGLQRTPACGWATCWPIWRLPVSSRRGARPSRLWG